MKRKKPSFNETYYGFRTFSHLLEDAQRRGHRDAAARPEVGQLHRRGPRARGGGRGRRCGERGRSLRRRLSCRYGSGSGRGRDGGERRARRAHGAADAADAAGARGVSVHGSRSTSGAGCASRRRRRRRGRRFGRDRGGRGPRGSAERAPTSVRGERARAPGASRCSPGCGASRRRRSPRPRSARRFSERQRRHDRAARRIVLERAAVELARCGGRGRGRAPR